MCWVLLLQTPINYRQVPLSVHDWKEATWDSNLSLIKRVKSKVIKPHTYIYIYTLPKYPPAQVDFLLSPCLHFSSQENFLCLVNLCHFITCLINQTLRKETFFHTFCVPTPFLSLKWMWAFQNRINHNRLNITIIITQNGSTRYLLKSKRTLIYSNTQFYTLRN